MPLPRLIQPLCQLNISQLFIYLNELESCLLPTVKCMEIFLQLVNIAHAYVILRMEIYYFTEFVTSPQCIEHAIHLQRTGIEVRIVSIPEFCVFSVIYIAHNLILHTDQDKRCVLDFSNNILFWGYFS